MTVRYHLRVYVEIARILIMLYDSLLHEFNRWQLRLV